MSRVTGESSARWAERYVDVGGVQTFYIEKGSGSPLVLVHGGGPGNGAEFTWQLNVDGLAERFRVIALDELGFGLTGKPRADLSLLARAEHVRRFLDALSLDRPILVGHSQGGFIATKIALEQPERVGRAVVVASGTTAPMGNMDERGDWAPGVKIFLTFRENPTRDSFARVWRALVYRPQVISDAVIEKHYRRFVDGGTLESYLAGLDADAKDPAFYRRLQDQYILPRLKTMTTPVLLLWGRDDDFAVWWRGLDLLRAMPTAEMHVFTECKHNVMMDQPVRFNRLVTDFCLDQV